MPKFTLEMNEAETVALINLATLGGQTLMVAFSDDPEDERKLKDLMALALHGLRKVGTEGWSALNDRIIIEAALVFPHIDVHRTNNDR